MLLELVRIPISDIGCSKTFYVDHVGFHADHDVSEIEDMGRMLYAYFADPDGNTWTLQQLPIRA